uniref:Uncharacterized protein n=1 Tax=Anguilla anguilla TaxID=7936 RepID=A0A0E9V9P4_ANGAN
MTAFLNYRSNTGKYIYILMTLKHY